jgi:hypothetical protein
MKSVNEVGISWRSSVNPNQSHTSKTIRRGKQGCKRFVYCIQVRKQTYCVHSLRGPFDMYVVLRPLEFLLARLCRWNAKVIKRIGQQNKTKKSPQVHQADTKCPQPLDSPNARRVSDGEVGVLFQLHFLCSIRFIFVFRLCLVRLIRGAGEKLKLDEVIHL